MGATHESNVKSSFFCGKTKLNANLCFGYFTIYSVEFIVTLVLLVIIFKHYL